MNAVLWVQRSPGGLGKRLGSVLGRRGWLGLCVGGVAFYRSGPVGPYHEVFAAPVMLRAGLPVGYVAFMAVDSPASAAGGRVNWALPKVLAGFEGDVGQGGGLTVRGDGWELTIRAGARPRALPVAAAARCAQVFPAGRGLREFPVRFRGTGRAARVDVAHAAPAPAAGWLAPGRHPGVLLSGDLTIDAPAPT